MNVGNLTKNENKYKGWVTPIVETCTYSLSCKERSVLFVFWLLVYLSILINSNCLLILSRHTAILWCTCTMQLFDCSNFLQGPKFYTWKKRSSILFIWSYFRWKVVVSVVDIDGIVANHCLNFLCTIDKFWKRGHLSLILDWLMLNVDVAVFQHIYILILLYTSEN